MRKVLREDQIPQTSKKRATSATAIPAETSPSRGILDELAERLGNFHESVRAMASCLQNHNVTRKTNQSVIEASKCMFHNLLGEASDDLERATPRTRESFCAETKQNKRRCARSETPRENPCPRPEALSEKPCSRSETLTGKLRSRFEMPSEKSAWQSSTSGTPMPQSPAESLEQVVEDDFRKQLELSVPQYELGELKYEFKMSSFTTTILNLLFTEAEQKGKTRIFRMHLDVADKLSLDLKFNPWETAITLVVSIISSFKLHEWMDTFQMNPKAICADMAFNQPHDMQAFYRMHNVKRLPTRPHTPWPNRAEMGVRLFKKFLLALVDTAFKESGPDQEIFWTQLP